MTSQQTTAPASTTSVFDRGRLVGLAALAVAVAVVMENAVLAATGAPSYATPITDVLAYYEAHRVAVGIASGLVAVYLPLLLAFVTGLQSLVARRGGAGDGWARFAVAAASAVAADFLLVNVLQMGVALAAGEGVEASPAIEVVWRVHAAAFALLLPMLGATFTGMALATHASGLTPAWQRVVGLTGGGLLLAAGVGSLAVADGSALIIGGLAGLAAWLVWLLATGGRLLRSGPR